MHQDLGVYSISVRNTHVCYMKFDFMRILHNMKDIGTEYVTYWYQFLTCCEILRGEIFSTDSSKCEIYCGSIKPFVPRFQK